MRSKKVPIIVSICLLILIVAGVWLYSRQGLVPQDIVNQTTFAIMVPEGENIEVDKDSMMVSTPQGQKDEVLNYTARIDGIDVLIGQQPTPQQFIDIPKTYEKVVEQAKQYASFETTVGTVYLTRPQKQQIAMLNTKGTYTLAQASEDLTEEQWRRFFRNILTVN